MVLSDRHKELFTEVGKVSRTTEQEDKKEEDEEGTEADESVFLRHGYGWECDYPKAKF